MAKYLQQSEKAAILPEGVAREYIELLLWAMEQTDSPNPIVREGAVVGVSIPDGASTRD